MDGSFNPRRHTASLIKRVLEDVVGDLSPTCCLNHMTDTNSPSLASDAGQNPVNGRAHIRGESAVSLGAFLCLCLESDSLTLCLRSARRREPAPDPGVPPRRSVPRTAGPAEHVLKGPQTGRTSRWHFLGRK
ncbi:hypothetical protein AAFF_G00284220 [Aldrovandia affinis]|uniref:Uncharacterized protein n=1 Tax=Aldrovandia affinis TaxID=143900 RepID=A0AAD7X1U4_9TELE|nr:hypothetical protein AAFF_G00284220 [Aldrovandia affinis]